MKKKRRGVHFLVRKGRGVEVGRSENGFFIREGEAEGVGGTGPLVVRGGGWGAW